MPLSRQSGFTLVELMVTIAVAAILLVVAVPSFQTVITSSRLTSAANEMVAAIQTARTDAIRYNKRTVVCLTLNPNASPPTCASDTSTDTKGWIVFIDVNKNGAFNLGTDTLLRVANVQQAVTILASPSLTNSSAKEVIFRSDGLARNSAGLVLSGVVQMCIASKRTENMRWVRIRGGSVIVSRATAAACATAPADAPP